MSATSANPTMSAPSGTADGESSAFPTLPARAESDRLVLVAGGDVSFGRMRGERLLSAPERDDFAPLAALFEGADLRFINLESTISEQGELQSPHNKLVFTAPPLAADALRRARIDVVSLANNHAWDYGAGGLLQTFEHLERVGIPYVGAGPDRERAYAPVVVERNGFRVAFVAVTAVWNQELSPHPGKQMVADADPEALVAAVKRARAIAGVDAVIVSHHGGYEYVDEPHRATMDLLARAIEAGADAVIGHHPHVVQRVSFVRGRPVLYSLGNLLMRMVTGKPWTEIGVLARLTLKRDGPATVELCPFRMFGLDPVPLASDSKRESYQAMVRASLDRLQSRGALIEPDAAGRIGSFGADGCAPVVPAGSGR